MRTALSIVFMWLIGLLVITTMWGCGNEGEEKSCTTTQTTQGTYIECPDGTKSYVANGKNGQDGTDGVDGENGQDGIDGLNGDDGKNGVDGQSCTVAQAINGAVITCGSSQAVVLNGTNGISPVLEAVRFCKKYKDNWPEVALKMSNGSLVAFFTDGTNLMNSRLVVLTSGWYQSTDSDHCLFYVDENNNIENK